MAGKKIMYVHGFLSSAQSGTVKMLQELMPNATLLAEDIPGTSGRGHRDAAEEAETEKPDLIIGTSMDTQTTERIRPHPRNPLLRDGQYDEQHDRQAGIPAT